ncbi:protein kinase domain-containing protein [Geminocystis herdmanii]|uniref:protein kinase domain-containing protein n=1 Tax=Geminocystis herdmanii TaxID=669359 RepID=UPI0003463162|nr:protein kinase [Geminocystis herdmanii]
MKINDIVASNYKIVDILEYFDFEQFYLVEKLGKSHKKYLLHNFDLSNNNELEKELIDKIKLLNQKSLINNRFSPLIEIVTENNNLQIIYEKIEGITLQKQIETKILWTEEEAIINLKYLLESIDLLHKQNLIHQMIKPQNIILSDKNKQLIINSYGKINIVNSPAMVTITIEDKLYIAPENIRGKTVFSSDIYSLGMVIISMITGKNAITLDEDQEGKLIWTNEEYFNENLVMILNKMIHPKISQRYQNILNIITDINKYFPDINNNNSGYIPTEIIPNNDQLLNTHPTEIISKYVTQDFSEKENQPQTIDKTQLIFPNYIEDEPKILSNSNIHNSSIIDDNSIINDSSIEQISLSSLNESNKTNRDNDNSSLNQQEKLFVNTHFLVNFITKAKTPKGIIISFSIASLIIFGFGFLKNYLYEKKIDSILEEITTLSDEKKYNDCIVFINSDKVQSLTVRDSIQQEFLGKCQLGLAELEALNNNFSEAIKIALRIDGKSSDYNRAKTFIDDWSKQILEEAKTMASLENNCSIIEEKLANIPQSSIWKKNALDLIEECKNRVLIINPTVDICPGPLCVE